MANEATIRNSLQIRKVRSSDNLPLIDYQSRPSAFKADVDGSFGPAPGTISVSITGTDVNLSSFRRPGLAFLMNRDDTNRVEYGVFEPTTGVFYPFGELLPGEFTVLRLSRNLQEQFSGTVTGTGTDGGVNNTLRLKAYVAACNVQVDIFEAVAS